MSTIHVVLVSAMLFSAPAFSKLAEDQVLRLGTDLTPLGAERAGSTDKTIPEWNGGMKLRSIPPDAMKRRADSYPGVGDDQALFVIDKSNLDQHRDRLSPGHLAMFENYGDTYKLPIYPARRTVFAPDFVYKGTAKNARNATSKFMGESIENAAIGIPFPMPEEGKEVLWNHKTRYRGQSIRRHNVQLAIHESGNFVPHRLKEDVLFSYSKPDATPGSLDGVMAYFLQLTVGPPRTAGQVLLVHETMDQISDTRRAWLYNPGQRRTRRAPNVAYDNPGTGADGLRTNDQLDVFNGATDRYSWKMLGKKDMYVPYNAYKLFDDRLKYEDIANPKHANQDLMRYELHRVWVVDSFLRSGTSHVYKRRTFYVDEDSWTILLVDIYDNRDQLWRVQEYHQVMLPWTESVGPAGHMIYDLNSRRYLAMELSNEEPLFEVMDFEEQHFRSTNLMRIAGTIR